MTVRPPRKSLFNETDPGSVDGSVGGCAAEASGAESAAGSMTASGLSTDKVGPRLTSPGASRDGVRADGLKEKPKEGLVFTPGAAKVGPRPVGPACRPVMTAEFAGTAANSKASSSFLIRTSYQRAASGRRALRAKGLGPLPGPITEQLWCLAPARGVNGRE